MVNSADMLRDEASARAGEEMEAKTDVGAVKRIVHVVPVYPPELGGMGRVAEDYVIASQERGHDVMVINASDRRAWFRFGNASFIPSLLWRLTRKRVDIVHLHYPFYGAMCFAVMAVRLFRLPLVVTYHMEATGDGIFGWFFAVHRALFRRWILKSARVVLVSSMEYARGKGVDRFLKSDVLTEFPFWAHVMGELPVRSRKDEGVKILFVGGMDRPHYFKGVEELLRAFAMVIGRSEGKVSLELIGDGELRAGYEALAKELGIEKHVTFHGAVADDQKWVLYVNSDIHVLPSTTEAEAFGIVTVEAMTAGIPSIVTDLPGVRSLVRDGVTGFVIAPGDVKMLADRLETLIKAPVLLDAMKQSAKERSGDFEREKLVEHLMKMYDGVMVDRL